MGWSFIAHRGSANNKTSGTSISVSPNAAISAGRVLVVRCVSDNSGTTSGQSSEHTSVSDSKGNTYTKIREQRYSAGAAADGVVGSLWISRLTTALGTSDTITLTLGAAVTAKAIGLEEYSITGVGVSVAGANGNSQAATTAPTCTLSGLTSAEYLWLGHVGIEGPNTDAFTQDSDYANNTSFGTSGGNAASNVASRFGSRVYTGTSDTYNPTLGTARDCVTILAAVLEVQPTAKSFSDVGGGSDSFGIPFKAMGFQDSAVGIEGFGTPFRAMSFVDGCSGADVFATPFRALVFVDAAACVDVFATPFRAMGFSDSAQAADSFSKFLAALNKAFSDVCSGSDAFATPFRAMGFADSASASDSFAKIVTLLQKAFADACSGLDVFGKEELAQIIAKAFADAAFGVDAFAVPFRAMGFSDSAFGVDLFFVPFRELRFSDEASAADVFARLMAEIVYFTVASRGFSVINVASASAPKFAIGGRVVQPLRVECGFLGSDRIRVSVRGFSMFTIESRVMRGDAG
ncbi:MAG: hypothetical protein QXL10_00925 [Candidatus Bathyarchaeia archaeon]